MIRALSILAAVVALIVSAAPVASAGTSKAKAPRFERGERATAFVWLAELSPVKATGFELSIDGHSMFHGSSGDGQKFVRRGKAKAPRLTSISDGTSNTMMRSGSLKPPKGRLLDAHFEI